MCSEVILQHAITLRNKQHRLLTSFNFRFTFRVNLTSDESATFGVQYLVIRRPIFGGMLSCSEKVISLAVFCALMPGFSGGICEDLTCPFSGTGSLSEHSMFMLSLSPFSGAVSH